MLCHAVLCPQGDISVLPWTELEGLHRETSLIQVGSSQPSCKAAWVDGSCYRHKLGRSAGLVYVGASAVASDRSANMCNTHLNPR